MLSWLSREMDMGLWPSIKNERQENEHEPDCPGIK